MKLLILPVLAAAGLAFAACATNGQNGVVAQGTDAKCFDFEHFAYSDAQAAQAAFQACFPPGTKLTDYPPAAHLPDAVLRQAHRPSSSLPPSAQPDLLAFAGGIFAGDKIAHVLDGFPTELVLQEEQGEISQGWSRSAGVGLTNLWFVTVTVGRTNTISGSRVRVLYHDELPEMRAEPFRLENYLVRDIKPALDSRLGPAPTTEEVEQAMAEAGGRLAYERAVNGAITQLYFYGPSKEAALNVSQFETWQATRPTLIKLRWTFDLSGRATCSKAVDSSNPDPDAREFWKPCS